MKNQKTNLVLFIGLLSISITQVLHQYMQLSDLVTGLMIGITIGFLLVALAKMKLNAQ